MKRKTLVFLLIVPFVIGLLTFVSVVALNNTVAISPNIRLNYGENYGFRVNGEYLLECDLVYDGVSDLDSVIVAEGSKPVWSVKDWDGTDDNVPTVYKNENDEWYLSTKDQEGTCTVEVSLENGRSRASFVAHIYEDGLIIINPSTSSNNRIDPIRYYGQYDLNEENEFIDASIPFKIDVYGDNQDNEYEVIKTSSNISFNEDNDTVKVINEGDAYFTLGIKGSEYIRSTYSFNIVKNGVNVYSFDQLMSCTNQSKEGEIVCLQVNLQSLSNTYAKEGSGDDNRYIDQYLYDDTRLFGDFNFETQSLDFSDLIYYQDSKIETKFIDQFLASDMADPSFNYSTRMKIGIRVQKDFYGNGFNINLHELAYPNHGVIDSTTGKLTPNRELDYFYGPLTFVSIGDIERLPVIRAYLCDNVGMLLDADNITLNDLKIQNSNATNNMYNLSFTGTVIEAQGNNITIKNSIAEWGRTCLRAFSCDNLLVDNCILENAGEFIVKLGSNKINGADHSKEVNVNYGNDQINTSFDSFFNGTSSDINSADYILSDIFNSSGLTGNPSKNLTNDQKVEVINDIQEGLDNYQGIVNSDGSVNYDAHVTINDTYFYNSGIFSIALESSFNGAYLYNGMPLLVNTLATYFGITPSEVGGTSFPIELTLSGDTRFYDWKDIDMIDATSLIEENFSTYLEQIGGSGDFGDIDGDFANLSIDSFFPMKSILKQYCIDNDLAYQITDQDNKTHYYVNRPIAYYGGGYNGSRVINNIENNEYYSYSDEIIVDIVKYVIEHDTTISSGELTDLLSLSTLAKCVIVAIGSHPFKFVTNGKIINNQEPVGFDEAPRVSDLIDRRN